MPVDIKIDLDIGPAQDEIAVLAGELEALEDIDADFSDMDFGEFADGLDDVADKMADIRMQAKGIQTDLNAAVADLDDAEISVRPDAPDGGTGAVGGEGDPPTDGGTQGMSPREFTRRMDNLFGSRQGIFMGDSDMQGFGAGPFRDPDTGEFVSVKEQLRLDQIDPTRDDRRVGVRAGFGLEPASMVKKRRNMLPSGSPGFMARLRKSISNMDFERINRGFNRLGEGVSDLRPTMRKWWALLALIIPLLISAGVQALGVAAALGAVATAGAAVLGLGLLGHAEGMGEAFGEAKRRLNDLKKELFEVFQPAMKAFAPISAKFFDFAPGELEKISEALEGLTAYEDTIFDSFSGLVDWIARAVDGMVKAEDTVSQLALRFGGLIGSSIIDFFGWLLRVTSRNQDLLIQLGIALKQIGLIVFNLSMVFSRFVAILQPLLGVFAQITKLLDGKLGVGMLMFLGVLWAMAKATSIVVALKKAHIVTLIQEAAAMQGYTLSTWQAVAATLALAGALSLVTFGASALLGGAAFAATDANIGGGPVGGSGATGISGGRGGGGKQVTYNYNNYEINHEGEMSKDSEQRIRSTLRSVQSEDEAVGRPSPQTNTENSALGTGE